MRRFNALSMAGFSLIELMVVIAIVAILAAVAIPTYQAQVRKGRRTDARTAVLDLAGREERYYSAVNVYTNDATLLGYSAAFPQSVGSGYYQVNIGPGNTNAQATSFVASATTIAGQPQVNDTDCQYFSVANTGQQAASDATSGTGANTTAECWH